MATQSKKKKQDEKRDTVQAVVETPRGCRNKHKLDEQTKTNEAVKSDARGYGVSL